MAVVGVVAIGRNEGERLVRCLESVIPIAQAVVYVDSNSTDQSVANAKQRGVECVQLDLSKPFTAARARNEGFNRLLELQPQLEFVLFLDGDCELVADFPGKALAVMQARPEVAVVCGRRRERFPDASVYNRLCDIEWNTPVGDADACGGDALIRVEPFRKVGLYHPELIAGEEPEMCQRLRLAGFKIARIDADMTLHDAAMTKFGQWWKRSMRAGFAYASNYSRTKTSPLPIWGREYRSNWIWGIALLLLPLPCLALAWWTWGLSLLPLLGFAWQGWRVYKYRRGQGDTGAAARLYSAFTVLGKAPQVIGQLKFHRERRATLIEYK